MSAKVLAGVTGSDVIAARNRISSWVHRTPVLTSSALDRIAGVQLFFKAENFQKTGAFKARGACNAVLRLVEQSPTTVPGVVTHSSGNHGQAVAYAAASAGLPCYVVVPSNTPLVKREAIEQYGGQLVLCKPTPASRQETADRLAAETGYHLVHPYNDYDVMAGQGTVALELLEQVPDLDAILVPVSGGGLASGVAVATRSQRPSCKVFVVEPAAKQLGPCLASKRRLWPNPPRMMATIADAIRTQQVGILTFPILCALAEPEVFSVTDEQMLEGMKLAFQRMKVVVEAASGAAVYAAVHQLAEAQPDVKRAGVIMSGGNTEFTAVLPDQSA